MASFSPPTRSLKRLTKMKKKNTSSTPVPHQEQDFTLHQLLASSPHLSPPYPITDHQGSLGDNDSRDSFPRRARSLDGILSQCDDSDDEIMPEVEIEQGDYKYQRLVSDAEKEYSESTKSSQSDDDGDGDSIGDSEDESVDEDDEQAVLSLLDKRRNFEASKIESSIDIAQSTDATEEDNTTKFSKKKMKASELEEIHAASQRLLRETPNACFKPQMLSVKPISSVLEKIRLRKLQLSQGIESPIPREQEVAELVEVETPDEEDSNMLKDMLPCKEKLVDLDGHLNAQEDAVSRVTVLGSKNPLRAPVEDTQDLFSHSRSSQEDVHENELCRVEGDDISDGQNAPVNLHIDTETQNDYGNWQDADDNKENMAPAADCPKRADRGPSVRALIDDEAEDEDEDEIGVQDDEEEADDDGQGLGDMIVEETQEKKAEARKRAELHRKWLEQQDSVTTDDILLRLKSGWKATENKKRGLEFLDDVEEDIDDVRHIPLKQPKRALEHHEDEMFDENENSLDSAGLNVENRQMEEEPRRFNTFDDADDAHESSDDEEREHRIMRERFLQESENQGEFMSPADDETSREVFVLINKVNIVSKTRNLKAGSVDLRVIGGGSSNSNSNTGHKASFLKRKTISGFNSGQNQKKKGSNSGSGTRSFIFGRDDSNSSHSFADHQKCETVQNKENVEPPPLLSALSSSSSSFIMKKMEATPTRKTTHTAPTLASSPSLFEILKGQNTRNHDAHSPHAWMQQKTSQISPIFSAFRPTKAAAANRLVSK